jgi:thiol-disulfide isomerase/thioredoxin
LSWLLSIYNGVTNFLKNTFQDRFKRYLIISLIILGIVIGFTSHGTSTAGEGYKVYFFYLPSCSHCEAQEPFNEKLESEYSQINITRYDATTPAGSALLDRMLEDLRIEDEPAFPITIFGNQVFSWESEDTTGIAIEEALQQCLAGNCPPPTGEEPRHKINLPLIGEIVLSDYSLPALAVILGLVDGFNPCAMWVLVYLISLVATLRDKKRIWLIVGSFVLASGILYFLFMTVWLNLFLFIGYLKAVTIVIGLVALGGGILQVKEVIETRGAIVCEVTDEESRKKTMSKVQEIVSSPLTWGILAGIIALAFTVNAVEFVCSAAVPAVFTRVLSLASLTTFQYYGYILLYVFFFMLDDLVIFGTAAFALTSSLGDRYAKYTRPVGATILIILGLLLLGCLYSAQLEFLKPICSVLW